MSLSVSYNTTTRTVDVTSCLIQRQGRVMSNLSLTTQQQQHGQLMSHPFSYNTTRTAESRCHILSNSTTGSGDVTSCLLQYINSTDSWCYILCPTTRQEQSQLMKHPVSYKITTTRPADVTSCLLHHNNITVSWCHILSPTTQQQHG